MCQAFVCLDKKTLMAFTCLSHCRGVSRVSCVPVRYDWGVTKGSLLELISCSCSQGQPEKSLRVLTWVSVWASLPKLHCSAYAPPLYPHFHAVRNLQYLSRH